MRSVILFLLLISTAHAQYNIGATFPPSKLLFNRDTTKPGYAFVPSGIVTPNRAQIWYAGSDAKNYGDHIFYRNAPTIDGPFGIGGVNTYEVALRPRHFDGVYNTFDAWHTCDPSVIKIPNGDWYLYYGGAAEGPDGSNKYGNKYVTEIGIATSKDGRKWTRLHQGRSILRSHPDRPGIPTVPYGTGQPSAVFKDGYVYVFYTDTVSPASNPVNGAGTYVIRSTDPTFFHGTQAWTGSGWVDIPNTGVSEPLELYLMRVSHPIAQQVVSSDVQYSKILNKFIMGVHGIPKTLETVIINADNFNIDWIGKTSYDSQNADGPGFFRGSDGSSVLGSGDSVNGLLPIRSIHAATPSDVFATKLKLSNTILTWGSIATGPLPQPPITPTPIVNAYWGYDDLGLASHCEVYLSAPRLPALSTVLEVFRNPIPCIERAIKEKGVRSVQLDLIDATCWRNRVCLPGAARPDDLREIEKRARIFGELCNRYPEVECIVSPALEHDVRDPRTVTEMLKASSRGCPRCIPINSPVSGATPPGYDVEWHGTKKTGVYISGDGASLFDGDNLAKDDNRDSHGRPNPFQHRTSGTKKVYAWWNELNERCTGEKDYVPPSKRTAEPEVWQYQMAHKILTTEEDAYPRAPRQCKRVRRIKAPEINKPTAERYCNGQPNANDARGNKNLLIIRKSRSGDKAIIRSDGRKMGCFKYYGTFDSPGLHRWYQGNCSGKNPWELYNDVGNEWAFADFGGGDCIMFNTLRREGVYR